MADSNPGRITSCLGGVARNVSENLARLGVSVSLLTAVGTDHEGKRIQSECRRLGIDLHHSLITEEDPSSSYLALMNEKGDLVAAISDMMILERLTVSFFEERAPMLAAADILIVDTNLSRESLEWLLRTYAHKKIFLDPVSIAKTHRVRDLSGLCHCLKVNRMEAEVLADMAIRSEGDLRQAAQQLIDRGSKRIFITLGPEGVYACQQGEHCRTAASFLKPASASGAGDAFMAAAIYGEIMEWPLFETARFSVAAAAVALLSQETVSEEMSVDRVQQVMESR